MKVLGEFKFAKFQITQYIQDLVYEIPGKYPMPMCMRQHHFFDTLPEIRFFLRIM